MVCGVVWCGGSVVVCVHIFYFFSFCKVMKNEELPTTHRRRLDQQSMMNEELPPIAQTKNPSTGTHLDELALDVQALEHSGDLRPPAMHHHHVDAQLFM